MRERVERGMFTIRFPIRDFQLRSMGSGVRRDRDTGLCRQKRVYPVLEKSKRSARQGTPGGRRIGFPRGFGSETDPAGV